MRALSAALSLLSLSLLAVAGAPADVAGKPEFIRKLAAGKPQRIVLYGTSLTAAGAWVPQLRSAVEAAYPGLATWVNSGGSGKASDWGVANLRRKVIAEKPDVVFIEFSMNDAAVTLGISREQALANLTAMVGSIRAARPDCEIILQVMNPVDRREGDPFSPRPDLKLYQQDLRDFAARNALLCIDHSLAFEVVLKKGSDAYREIVPDGVHPNAKGCALLITPLLLRSLGLNPDAKGAFLD